MEVPLQCSAALSEVHCHNADGDLCCQMSLSPHAVLQAQRSTLKSVQQSEESTLKLDTSAGAMALFEKK